MRERLQTRRKQTEIQFLVHSVPTLKTKQTLGEKGFAAHSALEVIEIAFSQLACSDLFEEFHKFPQ